MYINKISLKHIKNYLKKFKDCLDLTKIPAKNALQVFIHLVQGSYGNKLLVFQSNFPAIIMLN